METLKSKLKVVSAVAAAVVILLGGIGVDDALAEEERYEGFRDTKCVDSYLTVTDMATIESESTAGRLGSWKRKGSTHCWIAA